MKNFKPDSVENTIIRVFCEPQDNDVLSERNTILVIDTENSDAIDITVESYIPYSTKATSSSVSVSSNDSSSNSGYW